LNFQETKRKKAGATRQKNTMREQILISDEPVVGAFPCFLQNFADAFFVFFRAADDGKMVCCRITYRYGTIVFRKSAVNTSG